MNPLLSLAQLATIALVVVQINNLVLQVLTSETNYNPVVMTVNQVTIVQTKQ